MLNNVVVWRLFPWHLTINQNIRFICPADVGYSHLREFMQKLLQTPLQLQVHSTQQWISSKNINHDFPRGTKLSSVMHRNFGGKSSPNSIYLDTIISCFRPHQMTEESRKNQAISGIFFTGLRTFRPDQRMHLFLLFFWTTALKADSEESKSVGTKPYSGEQSCDIWTMLQKSSF